MKYMIVRTWCVIAVFLSLVATGASGEEDKLKQSLLLKASIDNKRVEIGTELRPTVSLVNISDKPIELQYLKPTIVVPEIWNVSSGQRVADAPTYVYDQICASQKASLAPGAEISLYALPILIAKRSPQSVGSDHLKAFWATLPGNFILKFSVPLNSFVPALTGQLHAKDIEVTVFDPQKELVGVLFFEKGKGYYLSMGSKGGKGSIWLQVSENKVLAQKLETLVGTEVKVSGCLERMPKNSHGSIPAGELYLSKLEIK